jgi:hypothetical protein
MWALLNTFHSPRIHCRNSGHVIYQQPFSCLPRTYQSGDSFFYQLKIKTAFVRSSSPNVDWYTLWRHWGQREPRARYRVSYVAQVPESCLLTPRVYSIVAIHGLNPWNTKDHAVRTWQSESGHLWLRDSLPLEVPNARTLLYEYGSSPGLGTEKDRFIYQANTLLECLRLIRRKVSYCKSLLYCCVLLLLTICATPEPYQAPNTCWP